VKILAIESSSVTCAAALCEEETLLAQTFQNSGLTHSRTLMPMLESLLRNSGQSIEDVALVAVAAGPGSFTGLRIGISAAKGLAWARALPCAACSTLEAAAWSLAHTGEELCVVMDARRGQVYNARFAADGTALRRLSPDRAIAMDALAEELKACRRPPLLLGDGAVMCRDALRRYEVETTLAPPHLRYPAAWGVARCALELARRGALTDAAGLVPQYHRLSQAERERLASHNAN